MPVFLVEQEDEENADPDDVVAAVRKLWNRSCIPATFKLGEWLERTEKAPVVTSEVEAAHKWPLLTPVATEKPKEPAQVDQGMYKNSSKLKMEIFQKRLGLQLVYHTHQQNRLHLRYAVDTARP